ncbi:MAG: hypothetical protein OWQ48_05640 [Desulfurococcus sp.]|nr:hypothetical protein [Desulfurococcus sp.]
MTSPANPPELRELSRLERLVLSYFLKHISVGEIIAIVDLREEIKRRIREGERDLVPGVEDPAELEREIIRVLIELVKKNILYYRNGAYSLSPWLMKRVQEKYKSLQPGSPKPLEKILEE